MTRWEYIWRTTYWVETSRTDDYVKSFYYGHVWKPDLTTEVPFPDQDGIDALGAAGWELVTATSTNVSLVTRSSPQHGESYAHFPTYTLFFKRPQEASN